MRLHAVLLTVGAALLGVLVQAVPAHAAELTVRIAADEAVAPIKSTDGYTLTVANATGEDVVAQDVGFLLPGHGTPPLKKGDVFGEPRSNDDVTAAFSYVPGSTSGFTTG